MNGFELVVTEARAKIARGEMDHAAWLRLSREQRRAAQDSRKLHPKLVALGGARVECERYGEIVRFNVGRSTGWVPCHLAVHNARSRGGDAIGHDEPLTGLRVIRYGDRA